MSERVAAEAVQLIRQLIREGVSNAKAGKVAGVSTSRVQREREAMRKLSATTKRAAGSPWGFVDTIKRAGS